MPEANRAQQTVKLTEPSHRTSLRHSNPHFNSKSHYDQARDSQVASTPGDQPFFTVSSVFGYAEAEAA